MKKKTALQRAIEIAGNQSALARLLKIRPQAVSKWKRVPTERAYDVQKITGIPCHELRPDKFPVVS